MDHIKNALQERVPSNFRDARMTLESSLQSTALDPVNARAAAYAVALSIGAKDLASLFAEELAAAKKDQAEVAAAIMGMTNTYYSFTDMVGLSSLTGLPAQIRMASYGQQAAKDALGFELATLAVSIAGKCRSCVKAHVEALQKLGVTDEGLRDVGRIAASVIAVSKVY